MKLKLGDWVVPKGHPFPSPYMKIEIVEIRKPSDYHILGEQVRVRYYDSNIISAPLVEEALKREVSTPSSESRVANHLQQELRDLRLKRIGI